MLEDDIRRFEAWQADGKVPGSGGIPEGRSRAHPPGSLRFAIAWVPPTLSRQLRMHRTQLPQLVQLAGAYIVGAVGKPVPPVDVPVRVKVTLHRRVLIRDDDNLHGMMKPIFDALVKLGWAHDDARTWMQQEWACQGRGPSGRTDWTEIEIEKR